MIMSNSIKFTFLFLVLILGLEGYGQKLLPLKELEKKPHYTFAKYDSAGTYRTRIQYYDSLGNSCYKYINDNFFIFTIDSLNKKINPNEVYSLSLGNEFMNEFDFKKYPNIQKIDISSYSCFKFDSIKISNLKNLQILDYRLGEVNDGNPYRYYCDNNIFDVFLNRVNELDKLKQLHYQGFGHGYQVFIPLKWFYSKSLEEFSISFPDYNDEANSEYLKEVPFTNLRMAIDSNVKFSNFKIKIWEDNTYYFVKCFDSSKWVKDEYFIFRDNNGRRKYEGAFKNGKPDGKWLTYYENGGLKEEQYYNEGIEIGRWVKYYPVGKNYEEYAAIRGASRVNNNWIYKSEYEGLKFKVNSVEWVLNFENGEVVKSQWFEPELQKDIYKEKCYVLQNGRNSCMNNFETYRNNKYHLIEFIVVR